MHICSVPHTACKTEYKEKKDKLDTTNRLYDYLFSAKIKRYDLPTARTTIDHQVILERPPDASKVTSHPYSRDSPSPRSSTRVATATWRESLGSMSHEVKLSEVKQSPAIGLTDPTILLSFSVYNTRETSLASEGIVCPLQRTSRMEESP